MFLNILGSLDRADICELSYICFEITFTFSLGPLKVMNFKTLCVSTTF